MAYVVSFDPGQDSRNDDAVIYQCDTLHEAKELLRKFVLPYHKSGEELQVDDFYCAIDFDLSSERWEKWMKTERIIQVLDANGRVRDLVNAYDATIQFVFADPADEKAYLRALSKTHEVKCKPDVGEPADVKLADGRQLRRRLWSEEKKFNPLILPDFDDQNGADRICYNFSFLQHRNYQKLLPDKIRDDTDDALFVITHTRSKHPNLSRGAAVVSRGAAVGQKKRRAHDSSGSDSDSAAPQTKKSKK